MLLAAHPLFNPDEGRYAEIPREMLASGEWLVPHLNGLIYIEKPPLQYWATAASLALFGPSEWAARFYTGACGLLTVLIVWILADRLWGREAAWRAGFMSGSCLLIVLLGHHLTLDMSLTLFMTVALAGFCLAQHHRDEAARSRAWMRLSWTGAALAMLTKGLVAVVLPAIALLVYSLLQRDKIVWRRLAIPSGLALFALIAAPWFLLMQRAVPQFFEFFFVREHFERYFTRIAERHEPWWFFGPILVAGCLPWLVPAGRAMIGGWRADAPRGRFDARRFLWVWVIVTFLFFSASDSKLVPYILPMFPALALLMATSNEPLLCRDLRITAVGLMAAGVTLVAMALLAPHLVDHSARGALFLGLRPCGLVMGVLAVTGGAMALTWRGPALSSTVIIGAASYLCFGAILFGARTVAPIYSGEPLAAQLTPSLIAGSPVFSVRAYDQTLPFYLRRTVRLVDVHGELDFGLKLEPGKSLATLAAFESQWRSSDRALAILEGDTYDELQRHALPMRVRARGADLLIVSRQ